MRLIKRNHRGDGRSLRSSRAPVGSSRLRKTAFSEPISPEDSWHDGIRRVGPGLKDIEARVLGPYREPHGLLESPCDPPFPSHELDPAAELDASWDVPRQEQAQHLLVRSRADARLSLRYEPLHPLVGDFAGFVVHVRPAPEVEVLKQGLALTDALRKSGMRFFSQNLRTLDRSRTKSHLRASSSE